MGEAHAGHGCGPSLQKLALLLTATKSEPQPTQQLAPSRSTQSALVLHAVSGDWRMSSSEHWPEAQTGLKYFMVASYSVTLIQGRHAPAPAHCSSCTFWKSALWLVLRARSVSGGTGSHASQQPVDVSMQSESVLQAPQSSPPPGHAAMHSSRVAKRLALPPQPAYANGSHKPVLGLCQKEGT